MVDKNTPGNDYTNDHTPYVYNNFALITSLVKEIAFGLTESTCAAANALGMLNIMEVNVDVFTF